MRDEFISYGAATGFSEETMTAVLDPVQIEQDMKDAISGLYAKSPYRYDRPAIAEQAYAAMEAEAAEKGVTLEGETADNVRVVAEAVRQVYTSATSVPLLSLLYTGLQKLRTVLLIGLPLCLVFVAMAATLMLRISRHDAILGARSLSFALGGAGLVSLVIGLAVAPTLGLDRLNLNPPGAQGPAGQLYPRHVWALCALCGHLSGAGRRRGPAAAPAPREKAEISAARCRF